MSQRSDRRLMQSLLKRNWSSRWVSCSYYKECSSRYNKRLKELYWPKKSVGHTIAFFLEGNWLLFQRSSSRQWVKEQEIFRPEALLRNRCGFICGFNPTHVCPLAARRRTTVILFIEWTWLLKRCEDNDQTWNEVTFTWILCLCCFAFLSHNWQDNFSSAMTCLVKVFEE